MKSVLTRGAIGLAMFGSILSGRKAVIVGGSSGIGLTIAAGLQEAGAEIAILSRNAEKLKRAADSLREQSGRTVHAFSVDVTDWVQFQKTIARIDQEFGPVDILVNSQGTTDIRPAVDVQESGFNTVIATNLTSVFTSCQAFGSGMIGRGEGSIINIASLAAHRGWPKAAAYAASKHGVAGLTLTLAAEWAPHGVRVNAISPGFFMTALNRERMPQERKDNAIRRTPMGRFGELEELTQAAVYLASPGASFVTGAILNVDGGYLASGI
jgi:NAD(P)-dependent dehydrogenase (short-subunit alcohol dehydrogenase family)